jgi:HD superfamily phosphodiesterase
MIKYNSPDVRRINHAIKVYFFAVNIAEEEACDIDTFNTIVYAAILHDIGIHEAEKKYGSSAGKFQEIEGPSVAKDLIKDIELQEEIKNRIFYLIGNHHTYDKIDGIDFQILVEADFLVNIYEDEISRESIKSIKNKVFKTKKGIELLDTLYLNNSNL